MFHRHRHDAESPYQHSVAGIEFAAAISAKLCLFHQGSGEIATARRLGQSRELPTCTRTSATCPRKP